MEDLLLSHVDIQDAAVIGIDDPFSGELPRAFIVRKDNSQISGEDVQKFVESRHIIRNHTQTIHDLGVYCPGASAPGTLYAVPF